MRDAAGEAAHGFHLLRVPQLLLELHALLPHVVSLGLHGGQQVAGRGGQQQEHEGHRLRVLDGQTLQGTEVEDRERDGANGDDGDDGRGASGAEAQASPGDQGQD